jgi:hypothetical protein
MNATIALTSVLLSMQFPDVALSQAGAVRLLDEQVSVAARNEDEEAEFVVQASFSGARPCIAVMSLDNDIAILFSRELVENLAAQATIPNDNEGRERINKIYALRAKALLESVTSVRTVHGCNKTSLNTDTRYLIGRLLNSGQAAIFDAQTRQFLPSFIVSISSRKDRGGTASYRVPDTAGGFRTFFVNHIWIR